MDTDSIFRRHVLEIAWGAFAAVNVVLIVELGAWETVPFHFVWVSMTLLYGIRVWTLRTTTTVLAVVCGATGVALLIGILRETSGLDELTEVPLMAAMFVAMVWHARRRQSTLDEVQRSAEQAHSLLESHAEFVRNASHVLRTPITVARGHAELIRDYTEDEQVRRDAEIILGELGRLTKMSERLLLLAASEHPNFLSLSPVEVKSFLLGIALRWRAARQSWLVDVPVEGTLRADEERLATAIDALIENAVKFTHPGDPIALRSRADGGTFVIEVSDGGQGIEPDELDRVFEPFTRARPVRRGRGGGTGLGLGIVKAIVTAHGGSVVAESAPGAGTTFTIRLPGFQRSQPAGIVGGEAGISGDPAHATQTQSAARSTVRGGTT